MKTLTLNNREYVFVPVPDGAYEFEVKPPKRDNYFRFNYRISTNEYHGMAFLYKDFGGKKHYPANLILITTTTDTIPSDLGITPTSLAYIGITGRHAIIEKI